MGYEQKLNGNGTEMFAPTCTCMNGPEMEVFLTCLNGESCGHLAGTRKLRGREGGRRKEYRAKRCVFVMRT